MPAQVVNRLPNIALLLVLTIFIIYPQLDYASSHNGFPGQSYSSYSLPVDYRHMALFQLKLNRYYYPTRSGNPDYIHIEHTHHHSHLGWWDGPFFWGGYTIDNDSSFSDRVSDGLVGVAVVLTVVAVAAATVYSVVHATSPYLGAAGLTSIELPEDSPWKITDYKVAHGGAIRYSDLAFNEDAMINAREQKMFDRQEMNQGRFLLVDQENWWGIVDYPVDVDVTFTHFDDVSGEATEQVTVNVQREVTNGMKAGTILPRVVHRTQNQQKYQLATRTDYPAWFNFSNWYHQPARIMIDFKPSGPVTPHD
ncbi:hypothetical protein [Endozoicomonas sp. GU-1]|uniref:hypothetical protein n=1 Tax=Endozoicomonas sp. GU-1 TaxID=3009078 RepID=UPI0022B418B2|nr:hypothetical protein [Endozoicomonas sp. GU-1]WBA82652.1 hypothetical protein O2T12_05790 [Endozoicomonas sp. GU-1]WBA85581.1 hypothetical protein O3276_20445 [Endozoicomonas sp. GU-1]